MDIGEERKLTVCLVRIKGVPILNGLELRLLPRNSYLTTDQARRLGQDVLVNLARVTCDPGTLTDNTSYRCALPRPWSPATHIPPHQPLVRCAQHPLPHEGGMGLSCCTIHSCPVH